jgi:PAS domain-containing protein
LDDLAAHRPVQNFEHSRTRPDGSLVWLSVNGLPIFDSEGVFTGYRGTGTDVTERRKTDMALRDSEERFRTLFEHIPISVWVEDWSAIKTMVDNLREEGVQIDGAYFRNQRQRTEELAENTLILDFNATTLDMYRAPSKEEFWSFANDFQTNDEFLMYCDTLAAFASGETRIVVSGWEETFDGEQIYVRDTVFIAGVILHPPLGIHCCV